MDSLITEFKFYEITNYSTIDHLFVTIDSKLINGILIKGIIVSKGNSYFKNYKAEKGNHVAQIIFSKGAEDEYLYAEISDQSFARLIENVSCECNVMDNSEISNSILSILNFERRSALSNLDSVIGAWIEKYNEHRRSGTITIEEGQPYLAEYYYGCYQRFNFTPKYSGNYIIETYGSDYDTLIKLRDYRNVVTGEDDNNGTYINSAEQRKSSQIYTAFSANTLYKIDVLNATTNSTGLSTGGYTYLIVRHVDGTTLLEASREHNSNLNYYSFNG